MDSRPSQKPLSWWMHRWKHWRLQNSTALKNNQKTKSRNTNHLNQEVMRPNETNPTGKGMKPPWATQNQVRPQRYRRTKRRAAGDEMNQDPRRQPKNSRERKTKSEPKKNKPGQDLNSRRRSGQEVVRRANTTPRTTVGDRYMVKREVFGCEGEGRRLGFLERRQRNLIFREKAHLSWNLNFNI
jgi:hypothetical protein